MAKKGKAKAKAKAAMKRQARTEVVRPEVKGKAAQLLKELDAAQTGGGLMMWEVEGDTLVGEFLGLETVKGKWGPQKLYTMRDNEGRTRTFYGSTVLDREMDGIKAGDTFGIQYRGTVPSGKGRPAKLFVVRKIA